MSTTPPKKDSYYSITYRDPKDGKIQTLKAHRVQDSTLGLSFISISDFVFDTHSLVHNPSEENMAKKFASIKSLHLSIYSILSIEEVGLENKGLRFKKDKSNLVVLNSGPSSSN